MYVYVLRVCYTFYQYSFLPSARARLYPEHPCTRKQLHRHPSTGGRRRHPRSFSKQPEGAKRTSRRRHFATLDSEVRVHSRPSRGRARRIFFLFELPPSSPPRSRRGRRPIVRMTFEKMMRAGGPGRDRSLARHDVIPRRVRDRVRDGFARATTAGNVSLYPYRTSRRSFAPVTVASTRRRGDG